MNVENLSNFCQDVSPDLQMSELLQENCKRWRKIYKNQPHLKRIHIARRENYAKCKSFSLRETHISLISSRYVQIARAQLIKP